MTDDRLLNAREVAERWGVTANTVLDRWQAGELPGIRIFGSERGPVRFRLSEIIALEQSWRRAKRRPPRRVAAWQEVLEHVTDEWRTTYDIAEAWGKGVDWTRRALKEAAFNGAAESRGGARGYGGAAMWRLSNADQEALDVTA